MSKKQADQEHPPVSGPEPGDTLYAYDLATNEVDLVTYVKTAVVEGATVPTMMVSRRGKKFWCSLNSYFRTNRRALAEHIRFLKDALVAGTARVTELQKQVADTERLVVQMTGQYTDIFERDLVAFTRGYIEAMIFTNGDMTDAADENLLSKLGEIRLSKACREDISQVCLRFFLANIDDIEATKDMIQAGRDLWFTRQGHGVGYWAREEVLDAVKERLTEAAGKLGQASVWVERGRIHHES